MANHVLWYIITLVNSIYQIKFAGLVGHDKMLYSTSMYDIWIAMELMVRNISDIETQQFAFVI